LDNTTIDNETRRVRRYQREVIRSRNSKKNRQLNGQKKKGQKDKQRSTKHTHKTKDRVTRTPLKTGGELGCSGRIGSSCSTSGIRNDNFCLLYLWHPSSWDHQIPIILFIRDLNVDTCTPLKCPGGFCFVALLC
jgi:hypothetical protein